MTTTRIQAVHGIVGRVVCNHHWVSLHVIVSDKPVNVPCYQATFLKVIDIFQTTYRICGMNKGMYVRKGRRMLQISLVSDFRRQRLREMDDRKDSADPGLPVRNPRVSLAI